MSSIQYNGKKLMPIENAYLYHAKDDPLHAVYTTIAIDGGGKQYVVEWEIVNLDADDEADCCDWSQYTVREW
jgi:hypothetical protein